MRNDKSVGEPMSAEGALSGKSGAVYQQVRAMILDGRLKPGHLLLEADVLRASNVSRSPARRALAALCADGMLTKHTGQGYVVPGGSSDPTVQRARLVDMELTVTANARWQSVYPEVEREIARQMLFRGVRIKEERMAEHFDVSRTVVREVLTQMRGVGLVQKNDAGRWIAKQMTERRIRDLYELRKLLEPEALALSAIHVSANEVEALEALIRQLIGTYPAVEPRQLDDAEKALHVNLVTNLCPNREIANVLNRTQLLLIANHYMLDLFIGLPVDTAAVFLNEHLGIVSALGRGEVSTATRLLRLHLDHSSDEFIGRFEQLARSSKPELPSYLTGF